MSCVNTRFYLALLYLLCAVVLTGCASAKKPPEVISLFIEPSTSINTVNSEPDEPPQTTIIRHRIAELNVGGITKVLASNDLPVLFNLFDGTEYQISNGGKSSMQYGVEIWNGIHRIVNSTEIVRIAKDSNSIVGTIQIAGRVFEIEPIGAGPNHRIIEIDTNGVRRDESEAGYYNMLSQIPKSTTTPLIVSDPICTDGPGDGIPIPIKKTEIDFMVAWGATIDSTHNMALKTGIMMSNIQKAMNTLKLTHYIQVNLVWQGVVNLDLSPTIGASSAINITKSDAQIMQIRNSSNADLVVYLANDLSDACGIAQLNENVVPGHHSRAYTVIQQACTLGATPAHEVGHLIGMRHDRHVDRSRGTGFNFGFSNLPVRLRTLMAYANHCNDSGISCPRINRYSSPKDILVPDPSGKEKLVWTKMGIKKGQPFAAHNEEILCKNIRTISRFRL